MLNEFAAGRPSSFLCPSPFSKSSIPPKLARDAGTWVEDDFKAQAMKTGTSLYGYKGDFQGATTQRTDFNPDGRTGQALLESYRRNDK